MFLIVIRTHSPHFFEVSLQYCVKLNIYPLVTYHLKNFLVWEETGMYVLCVKTPGLGGKLELYPIVISELRWY